MKVAIVGSRKRIDKQSVIQLVDSLSPEDVVVSGGCSGVDTWAEERAKLNGINTIIFKPKIQGCKNKGEMVNAYYERNKLIAKEADVVYAFVCKERTGGTENTIKHAKGFGKPVYVMEEIKNGQI